MRFDAAQFEVRTQERTIYGASYERNGLFKLEKVKEFRYETGDMREPLVRAIYRSGGECRNVVIREL